jgi:beta-lactamase regulating signal transducer with metallopeptidase domain
MLFTAIETNKLLIAIGVAMLHSIVQTAISWLMYIFFVANTPKISAANKHTIALSILFLNTLGFIYLVFQQYFGVQGIIEVNTLNIILTNKLVVFVTQFLPYLSISYIGLLLFKLGNLFFYQSKAAPFDTIKPSLEVRLFTKNNALLLGITKKVQIWCTQKVQVPQIKGCLKPVILLPVGIITQLSTQQIEAIILHELAHVKRQDYLLHLVQIITESILIFNPFAYLLGKIIRAEREHSCDDLVLQFKYDNKEYATALYFLELQRQQNIQFAIAATNNKNLLLKRIKRIIEKEPVKSSFSTKFLIGGMLSTMLLFSLLQLKVVTNNKEISKNNSTKTKNTFTAANLFKASTTLPVKQQKNTQIARTSQLKQTKLKENDKFTPINNDAILVINEHWLAAKQKATEDFALQAAQHNFQENDTKSLIKVQEEQSGSTDIYTYYFEATMVAGEPKLTLVYIAKQPLKNKATVNYYPTQEAH